MVQTSPPVPEVAQVEPARPLTEFLVDRLHLKGSGLTTGIVSNLIEPILQIALIVALAFLLLRLLRRLGQWIAGRVAGGVASASGRGAQRVHTIAGIASNTAGAIVWTAAFLSILSVVFGISLGPLLAGAGILSIAFGFGARDLVKDMVSGLFMIIEGQYDVGDFIDAGIAAGTVERLGLRSTRLLDEDGTLWHVPNGEIRRVGNKSQAWSRVLLDIAVAYDSDIERVLATIEDVATRMYREDAYKGWFLAAPDVQGVEAVGNDKLVVRLVVRIAPGHRPDVIARELRRRIKPALDAAGICPPVTTFRTSGLPGPTPFR